jgi:hypothetical protein
VHRRPTPQPSHAILHVPFIALAALFASTCALTLWGGREPLQRLLLAWVLICSATEFLGFLITWLGHMNVAVFNVFILVEFVLLLRLAALWPQGRAARSPWLLGGFAVCWAVEMWHIGARPQMTVYTFLLATLVYVAFYLLLLWAIVNEHRGPLSRHAPFWLCLSVLLFFGGVAPIFGSVNYFIRVDRALANQLYWGVRILAILKFVLMGITCLQARPAKVTAA